MKQHTHARRSHARRCAQPRRAACRSRRTAVGPQADADKKPAPQAAGAERGVPPRARRQAAHRGLQGSAAVAVGADPARRQDHAAARSATSRRAAARRSSCATRSPQSLKEYITNPTVTVIVVEALASTGVRDGRSHASRADADARADDDSAGARDGGRLQGIREHQGRQGPAPDGHGQCRRSASTTRTRSTATSSRSFCGRATP